MAWRRRALLLLGAWLGTASCGLIVGIEDLGGDKYTGGASSSGNPGGSGPGGAGGSGGEPVVCEGEVGSSCYDGPPGTEGIGECTPGTCNASGICEGMGTPYTENCYTGLDENCDTFPGCDGAGLWSAVGRGPGRQDDIHVAIDAGDSVLLGGSFYGQLAFRDPDGNEADPLVNDTDGADEFADIFLAKLGPDGSNVWSKRFGGDADQRLVAIDSYGSNQFVIGGNFMGELDMGQFCQASSPSAMQGFVAFFDGEGSCQWLRSFRAEVRDVAATESIDDGLVFVGGGYEGSLTFGDDISAGPASSVDAYLVTLDSGGTFLGIATSAGAGVERITHVESNNGFTWAVGQYDSDAVTMAGVTLPYTAGNLADVFLARREARLGDSFETVIAFGGPSEDIPHGVAVDDEGAAIVAVDHTGGILFPGDPVEGFGDVDSVLVKYPPSGTTVDGGGAQWVAWGHAAEDQSLTAVAADHANQIVVSATIRGTPDFCGPIAAPTAAGGEDALVHKLAGDIQQCVWTPAQHFGTAAYEAGTDVAVDSSGNVVLVGFYNGKQVDMKGGKGSPLPDADTSRGSPHDLFITKRRP